jgi:hypothetical protein
MRLAIGPVLKQHHGYAFDIWSPDRGLSRSYAYPRIEDAHYARRCAINEAALDARLTLVPCRTSEEFAKEAALLSTAA